MIHERERLPSWMKMKRAEGVAYSKMLNLVNRHSIHTICKSGNCPNIGECWSKGTATLMILGDTCTRSCKFCGVKTGKPLPPDESEPSRIAETVHTMGLGHIVITSVNRDDLPDGGASHWVKTIGEIKKMNPGTSMEVLIPDFQGKQEAIQSIVDARPEVISHNLETVERLTPAIRSSARYKRSLSVIRQLCRGQNTTKSGIMLGLGETEKEVLQTMDDLLEAGCEVFTIGQYLQPNLAQIPVKEYVKPEKFEEYKNTGLAKGFEVVESSPLVRSSYNADRHVTINCDA